MPKRPLDGVRVIEFAGLAPGPFCGRELICLDSKEFSSLTRPKQVILADFGATVIRIDRPHARAVIDDVLCRGKQSIAISLKSEKGKALVLRLIATADVIIDPFRPGVLEKLGLGPQECAKVTNDTLVYARLSGFQRTGPYSQMAGHDINYIALAGVLAMIQPPGSALPVPPLNLVADFAGGGLLCALGILMALFERTRSGKGQVVEADMVNGSRYVASFPLLLSDSPLFSGMEGNMGHLSGAAPWYGVYRTKCGGYMSVGAIEPQFYAELLRILGPYMPSPAPDAGSQHDTSSWSDLRNALTQTFASKTREEWTRAFVGTDACVAPVLTPSEVARDQGQAAQPAPLLVRTPAQRVDKAASAEDTLQVGRHTLEILRGMGISQAEIEVLAHERVVEVSGQKGSKL